MPWKEHGVMEERFRFVEEWNSGDWSMAELCRHYGVTRATGYKWVDRYELGGVEALRDQLGGAQGPCQAGARARRREAAGREYDGRDSETQRVDGGAEAAAQQPASQRAVGACGGAEHGVVRRLQGMVSGWGWDADRSTHDQRCL